MKKLLLIAMLAALAGCTKNSANSLEFPAMPAEFADCKIVHVTNLNGEAVTMARCPNATTTTQVRVQQGKTSVVRTAIVVDGTTYEAKP